MIGDVGFDEVSFGQFIGQGFICFFINIGNDYFYVFFFEVFGSCFIQIR